MSFDMREVTMNGRGQGKFADSLAFEILRQRDDLFKKVNELEEQLAISHSIQKQTKQELDNSLDSIRKISMELSRQPIYLGEIEIDNLNKFKKSNGGYYDSISAYTTGIGVKLVARYKDIEEDITNYTNW